VTAETPMVTLTCDGSEPDCAGTVEVETTEMANQTPLYGVEDENVEEVGWLQDGDNHYCPACRKAEEAEGDTEDDADDGEEE
jgi:hypothetical protein